MTAERAIENLKDDCKTMIEYCECNNGKCDCYIDMAIAALEKQIPMKCGIKVYEDGCGVFFCKSCKRIASSVQKYCENCGQKLDFI